MTARSVPAASTRVPEWRTALVLALLALLVYNANGRLLATGDSRPARFLPFAILSSGTLRLDALREAVTLDPDGSYWLVRTVDGHLASGYPIVTPLLVTPLYLPAVAYLQVKGWSELRLERIAALFEKLSASVLAAAGVGLLFLLLRRRCTARDSLLLAGAYAFGTNVWSTSSQALWQHAASHLFLIAALLVLTRVEVSAGGLALCGTTLGLLAANRPPDAAFSAALGVVLLLIERRRLLAWAVPFGSILVLTVAYNIGFFGRLTGGYGASGHDRSFFARPLLPGLAGLILSPGKGILFYTPFLAFAAALFFRKPVPERDRLVAVALGAAIAAQLLVYAKTDIRAGWSFGPRFLLDAVPALVWLLAPVVTMLSGRARVFFLGTVAWSVAVQCVGSFCYPNGGSDVLLARENALWSLSRSPVVVEGRAGPARPELLDVLRDRGRIFGEPWRVVPR